MEKDEPLNIYKQIKSLAERLGFNYKMETREELKILYLSSHYDDFHTILKIDENKKIVFPYIKIKTSSWIYPGERTDLHDIISQLLSSYIRVYFSPKSISIWNDPNDFSNIPGELYSRLLIFEQPSSFINFNSDLISEIKNILGYIIFYRRMFYICSSVNLDKDGEYIMDYDYQKCYRWAKRIAYILEDDIGKDNILFNNRISPNWNYYRSIDKGISLIQNHHFCKNLYHYYSMLMNKNVEIIESINGLIYSSNGIINNFISNINKNIILQLMNNLNKKIANNVLMIPSDNYIAVFSNYYTLFIKKDCSRKLFEIERNTLMKRHIIESKLLFPALNYTWAEKINDEEFENFVYDILLRDEGITWIRRLSKSRERDDGRDLMAEIRTPPLNESESKSNSSVLIKRKIIIQSKAYSNGLGKTDVQDILDTIECHNADGYFLVTSSYLKGSLSNFLLKMRGKNKYFVNWWARKEIEEKVKAFPDLIDKYSNIFLKNTN